MQVGFAPQILVEHDPAAQRGRRRLGHGKAIGPDADHDLGPARRRRSADREAGTAAQPDLAGAGERALEEVHLRRADEARDEQVGRAPVELLGRADLLDDALVHDHDPVGEGHGLDLVVGDVDHGGAQLLVQPRDLEPDGRAQGGVEVGERLVEQEHLAGGARSPGRSPPAAAGRRRARTACAAAGSPGPGCAPPPWSARRSGPRTRPPASGPTPSSRRRRDAGRGRSSGTPWRCRAGPAADGRPPARRC